MYKEVLKQELDLKSVYLPFALERKYKNASREWIWQFVFSSARISLLFSKALFVLAQLKQDFGDSE
ncbi:MAG: hypothetical protein ACFCU7_04535 [Pleurocapsa sp.]